MFELHVLIQNDSLIFKVYKLELLVSKYEIFVNQWEVIRRHLQEANVRHWWILLIASMHRYDSEHAANDAYDDLSTEFTIPIIRFREMTLKRVNKTLHKMNSTTISFGLPSLQYRRNIPRCLADRTRNIDSDEKLDA